MRRLRGCALAVWLAVGVAACGADEASSKPDSPGPDLGPPPLPMPVEPTGPTYAIGKPVTVTASLGATVDTYVFTVLDPAVHEARFELKDPKNPRSISFTPQMVGTYAVRCSGLRPDGSLSTGDVNLAAVDPDAPAKTYVIRITPPPLDPRPAKRYEVQLKGADLLDQQAILEDGSLIRVSTAWSDSKLDTQLRLYREANDPAPRDLIVPAGQQGTTLYLPTSSIVRGLFLPSQPVEPALALKVEVDSLEGQWPVRADSVAVHSVSGTVMRGGTAVKNAAVSIAVPDCGLLVPSSVATTGESGNFTVKVRAAQKPAPTDRYQKAIVMVAPAALSGLPVAEAALDSPLQGAAGWTFAYQTLPTTLLEGQLSRAGGGVPKPGAMVLLSAKDEDAPQVATLTMGTQVVPARARLRYTLVSDAAGLLREAVSGAASLQVPAGTYLAEVWPGKGETTNQGYSRTTVQLAPAQSKLELSLGRRVTLRGKLTSAVSSSVVVSASTTDGRTFTTSTDVESTFSLMVDGQSTYALSTRAQGLAGRRLAGVPAAEGITRGVVIGTSDRALPDLNLPGALVYSAWLRRSSGAVVPGAVCQIWEGGALLDETLTRVDGYFELRVPR